MRENVISFKIIGAALKIHRTLGPGLLESVYEAALIHDLTEMGLEVKSQVPMPFVYREVQQGVGIG